ncbi:UDP-3-O-acyl-N-acetylglucosamine deacetylase [Candidatus Bandiella euplotis]|uniref:UDP-3-O-acyl-N-acetylglucosamine deacetylase n=1 Tax=Candidatus Bandiella euplotis TaxID=1664265 RepID=A0ABZ0UQH7_9RICK|nr:UDP-3-O-acyl-N-acetylglucosamine deacetylase [Candidatus Bandiella woodruffii]WPX96275.1 UDP-3-O-[3-hydroxymyristoyl] N-acetylglucosamine deacetylase [Candidatus Bandiella woodruffii]
MEYQQTIRKTGVLSGIGLHSGADVQLKISPLEVDSGIVFKRSDISSNNIVPAKFYNVTDTKMCTEISNEHGVKISTIEHLMAALWGMKIDNALVELTGPEVPAMDGSSKDFVELIKNSGLQKQFKEKRKLKILKTIKVVQDDKEMIVRPSDKFSVNFAIDFQHQAIGKQSCEFTGLQEFEREIGYARTFGFFEEVEYLKKIGLAKGASLTNSIGLDANGVMNPGGLRCKDEFVRHKILDCVGDLFLSGYEIIGEFEAKKAGHNLNNQILRKIFQTEADYRII